LERKCRTECRWSYTIGTFFPSIKNWLFIPSKHFCRSFLGRSRFCTQKTHMRTARTIPSKKRALRSRLLCNVKAEGWLSSDDDATSRSRRRPRSTANWGVQEWLHSRRIMSESSFRIRCTSLHCVPTMQVMCHQHMHKSRAIEHVSSGPLLLTNNTGTFISRDIVHKSWDYYVGKRATQLIKIVRLHE